MNMVNEIILSVSVINSLINTFKLKETIFVARLEKQWMVVTFLFGLFLESQSTAAGFAQMMHLLTPLAQGRLALIFEKSDIERASLCCSALLGDPLPKTPTLPLHPTAGQTLRSVLSVYRPFWSRLAPSVDLPEENVLCPGLIADPKVFQDNKNLSLEFTARLHRFAQDQRSLKLD